MLNNLEIATNSQSLMADAWEVRIATRLVGKRRLLIRKLKDISYKLGTGVLADAATSFGVSLEEGPIKRTQERLMRHDAKRRP